MAVILAFIFSLCLASTPLLALAEQTTPLAKKRVNPLVIQQGEWAEVNLIIEGYSRDSVECIPFDLVLLMDQSGSMGSEDPNNDRITAAKAFIDKVIEEQCSSRIALVTFADDSNVESGLTANYSSLMTSINGLQGSEGGGTNLTNGMEEAQNTLIDNLLVGRTENILLLTDGWPTGSAQAGGITAMLNEAVEHNIRYFVVPLGDADPNLTSGIAEATGGMLCANELTECFLKIFNEIAHTLAAQDIWIKERLSPLLSVKPGSLSYPEGLQIPTPGEVQQFYSSGVLDYRIGELGINRQRSLSFKVTAENCLPEDERLTSILIPVDWMSAQDPSRIEFSYGDFQNIPIPIEQQTLECLKPGGYRVEKIVDPVEERVSITIWNSNIPRPLRSNDLIKVIINEPLFPNYQYKAGSIRLSNGCKFISSDGRFDPLGRINSHIQSREVAHAYLNIISDTSKDHIIVKVDKVLPQEKCTITFLVESRACSETHVNPLHVNDYRIEKGVSIGNGSVSLVSPNGDTVTETLPTKMVLQEFMEECEGRPNIFMESAMTKSEYFALSLSGTYSSLPDPPHVIYDSESIWVDSSYNEFVSDWSNQQQVESNVDGFIAMEQDGQVMIEGQGDKFLAEQHNKICVQIGNSGSKEATYMNNDMAVLDAYRYIRTRPRASVIQGLSAAQTIIAAGYDTVAEQVMPPVVQKNQFTQVCFDLPAGTISDRYRVGQNDSVYFRVVLPSSHGEKHTNNNVSYEVVTVEQ